MRRSPRLALYLVPIAVIALLVGIYALSPELYLRWVLEPQRREGQLVEIVTAAAAVLAAAILVWATIALWRRGAARGAVIIVGIIALATIGFAGEEVSWGQWIFRWETPEWLAETSPETNLHNVDLPVRVQSLGGLFLLLVFVALPLLWLLRRRVPERLRLPEAWWPAIAEGPVVVTVIVANLWDDAKDLYRLLEPEWDQRLVYHEFIEQMPEHKEMLIAVALLMYAGGRIAAVRRLR